MPSERRLHPLSIFFNIGKRMTASWYPSTTHTDPAATTMSPPPPKLPEGTSTRSIELVSGLIRTSIPVSELPLSTETQTKPLMTVGL